MDELDRKPGHPTLFTDDQKSLVTELWSNNPKLKAKEAIEAVMNYLVEKERKNLKRASDSDLKDFVGKNLLARAAIINFLTELNKKKPSPLDSKWSTANLLNEALSPEAVRWLIALQVYRKSYYSKPLTIREAKWFNHLFGFRDVFAQDLTALGISPKLREVFIFSVIATWAQIYGYREKIDTIAEITKLDFSDIDNDIANLDFEAIENYNDKWFFSVIGKTSKAAEDNTLTKEEFQTYANMCFLPSLIANVRAAEMRILFGYSLGDPDMSQKSMGLYSYALRTIFDGPAIIERLFKLPNMKKKDFLVYLREEVKNNPDTPRENFDQSFLEIFLQIAEKDGKVNG